MPTVAMLVCHDHIIAMVEICGKLSRWEASGNWELSNTISIG